MASPVVAGTVALMMQANPNLTPNLVKAILQYTAQTRHYDPLTQGGGFLNAEGAVELARFFKNGRAGDRYPHSWMWSRQVIWGNNRLKGGVLKPNANAWAQNIVWGTAADDQGENIVWGTVCADDCENIVWGTLDSTENIVWGTVDSAGENIVWGTASDGRTSSGARRPYENIVWGTACDATATTSSGAPAMDPKHRVGHARQWREHRLGHHPRSREHRVGNGFRPARTSSGARRRRGRDLGQQR